jgi:hypothetical protein
MQFLILSFFGLRFVSRMRRVTVSLSPTEVALHTTSFCWSLIPGREIFDIGGGRWPWTLPLSPCDTTNGQRSAHFFFFSFFFFFFFFSSGREARKITRQVIGRSQSATLGGITLGGVTVERQGAGVRSNKTNKFNDNNDNT